MQTLKANIRNEQSTGKLNALRGSGLIPGIIYGGKETNTKISIEKNLIKNFVRDDSFLSTVVELDIDGKKQKVIPRDVAYHVVSDEPIHIDFMRLVSGSKVILEIPVEFINHNDSPGLKRGGVLNIVRRKVELSCPADKIPSKLVVDLAGLDIGASVKISSIKLPENVKPTIQGRDFVISTVAAPTIVQEPEKPAEEADAAATGEAPAEGEAAPATEATAGKDDKGKPAKEAPASPDKKSQPEKK